MENDRCVARKFQAYEISYVRENTDGTCEVITESEPLTDEHFVRSFWSLYGWREGAGVECIGDYKTVEHAGEILSLILGAPLEGLPAFMASYKLDGSYWV